MNNKKFKKYLFFGIVMTFIAAVSMFGTTYAWFTGSSITLENIFTAGTVEIEAVDISGLNGTGSDTDIVSPGDTLEKTYEITNTGSKSIYVRARFEGYWERIYHKNTATATATFNGIEVTDSDVAHFYYENEEPAPGPVTGTSVGFTNNYFLANPLKVETNSNHNTSSDTSSNFDNNLLHNINMTNSLSLSDYPDPCDGPKVVPISGDDVSALINHPPDPDPTLLESPVGCDLIVFKVEGDQDDIGNGDQFFNNGFEVTIYKKEIDGKYYFAFESNYPVYHLYAKGGNQEGNLYQYYPGYEDGVYTDCGLSQPGGDWSHITFYYCEPPDDPELKLTKEVLLDGGDSWQDAEQSPGPKLDDPSIIPMFRFVVENTGNVTLSNIEVVDDVLDLNPDDEDSTSWIISQLAPGETAELEIDYVEWTELISMNNIQVELCEDMENWVPEGLQDLGTYFYHTEVLKAQGDGTYQVTLCVNITFEDDGSYYDGTEFTLYSFFEAVQASNDIILENWPREDLDWYFE